MSEPKWTAGPYEVRDRGHGFALVSNGVAANPQIAWVSTTSCAGVNGSYSVAIDEARANAALFAAAPELYAALDDLIGSIGESLGNDFAPKLLRARAALAAARGDAD